MTDSDRDTEDLAWDASAVPRAPYLSRLETLRAGMWVLGMVR